MRQTGKIKHWNKEKKYGFIKRPGLDDVFFHMTGLVDRNYTPREGDTVEFSITETDRGPKAEEVEFIG